MHSFVRLAKQMLNDKQIDEFDAFERRTDARHEGFEGKVGPLFTVVSDDEIWAGNSKLDENKGGKFQIRVSLVTFAAGAAESRSTNGTRYDSEAETRRTDDTQENN